MANMDAKGLLGIGEYESVKRWLNAVYARGTGSATTQLVYLRFFTYFLNFTK